MTESISFDRAASFYDKTRALPNVSADAITGSLLQALRDAGADSVLEVGIGTGRMARPLMQAGVRVTGIDISHEMLGQLRAQLTPEHTPPDLLLGDATRLPFRDKTFPAALVVHVFHLVASAEVTIGEIRRVVRPGGVLLQQIRRPDGNTERLWQGNQEFWDTACARAGHERRRRPEYDEIDQMLRDSGATLTDIEVGPGEWESTVEEEMARIRTRENSWTWIIPGEILDGNLEAHARWLREQTGGTGRWTDRVTYIIQVARWT